MVIVGIDEAGRGSWAGPLVAAAVVFSDELTSKESKGMGLFDSKVLSALRRIAANREIYARALGIGIGWVSAAEIDTVGLTKATTMAMQRALDQITVHYDTVIIDGNYNYLPTNPKVVVQIKADCDVAVVSAASIVAKVARDSFMMEMAIKFPGYGFERHVGYGTALHSQEIVRQGLCELHRKTYKPIIDLGRLK